MFFYIVIVLSLVLGCQGGTSKQNPTGDTQQDTFGQDGVAVTDNGTDVDISRKIQDVMDTNVDTNIRETTDKDTDRQYPDGEEDSDISDISDSLNDRGYDADGQSGHCTSEGNTFSPGTGRCCDGLKPISTAKPDSNGNCPQAGPGNLRLCTKCGNGSCETDKGENMCNCPDDCKVVCGDGTCDSETGENCGTCPADCACAQGQTCYNNACCTPKTCADLGYECGSADDMTVVYARLA